MGRARVTPVRRQYLELKARYPDAILLFRLGDFYETFDEDAKLVAAELDIVLTSKPMGGGLRSPLAGVPVRSVDQHLARLVARGHRVAICEQLEQPSAARKLVRRGVVRVVSPGTALEPALLEAGRASACAAVWVERPRRGRSEWRAGVASAEISTGACYLAELGSGPALDGAEAQAELWRLVDEQLARMGARELLVPETGGDGGASLEGLEALERESGLALSRRPAHEFGAERAARAVARQFGAPAEAFALEPDAPELRALGALLEYLRRAVPDGERDESAATDRPAAPAEADGAERAGGQGGQSGQGGQGGLRHLSAPVRLDAGARLEWDRATGRALAIVEGEPDAGGADTLVGVIDRCATAPGRRRLREALAAPLLDPERIARRLDRVEALIARPALRRALAARLRGIGDLERLLGRACSALASPRELAALAGGLGEAEALAQMIATALPVESGSVREADPSAEAEARAEPETDAAAAETALRSLAARLAPLPEPAARLGAALAEEPAAEYGSGVVRAGVDAAVDEARARAHGCRERLAELETTLREETGIDSLTLGYHRSFGYLIELTRSRAGLAPERWERRQSLRDRERFSEPRLRAIAGELEEAEAELREAERDCVERLRDDLAAEAELVRERAGAVARLDVACSLAAVAAERAWTRPELDHSGELAIEGGRHPIVEARAAPGGFVPNDLHLAADGLRAPQLLLVSGPNMAGKSTYLRQTALIAVLAQAGSFVPAARARVGLVDRIFARVGAHDELARGRSTFMVEMLETARLLHGAGERSLVLLDEVGRGTSTWDGMAIARAVVEELAGAGDEPGSARRGPRTLFATHFHELTALAGTLDRVRNAAVQVEQAESGELVFPYRVRPGAADRSYGVQVASQAGLPRRVIERAEALLEELERPGGPGRAAAGAGGPDPGVQDDTADAADASGSADPGQAASGYTAPQLMLMPPPHPILADLADLDVDGLTPLEAISALYALRDQAQLELRDQAQLELREQGRRDMREQGRHDTSEQGRRDKREQGRLEVGKPGQLDETFTGRIERYGPLAGVAEAGS